MRRSAYRRAAAAGTGRNRRLLAVGAVIAAMGAVVAFTQISNAATNETPAGSDAGKVVNGQVILTDTCVDSKLPAHTGFQDGDRCVSTEFGEVGSAANNPTLLITAAPKSVTVNTPFELKISTRNLIRDRFLAAGKGGYYVESSVLQNGLVRGHFHTACRMLTSTNEAPAPDPVPAFFVATEDSKGTATPDTVTIAVPGMPTAGVAQCASWAGDGSHRIPMMQRANQVPAYDSVRVNVRDAAGGGNNNGGGTGGNNNGGATTPPATTPATTAPATTAPATTAPATDPATTAPATTPTTRPTRTHTKPAGSSTTQPTTKDDFTPATPSAKPESTVKPATTTKPAGTKTTKSTTGSDSANSDSNTNAGTSDSDTPAVTTTTKAPKPKSSSSKAAAAGDYTYSQDDGVANSGTKAPTTEQLAEPTANETKSGLAKTGSNTIAAIGGGVVLLLVGLGIMAFTRRRRPSNGTW
jgi:LPXTG-motif cell wall-anchored protein